MPHIRLTLRKPGVFGAELFTYPDDVDTWTETDSGLVTISVETVSSRTFMRFVTSAVTEGVFKDFTVTSGQKVSCSFFVKSTNDTDQFTAIFHDQTNDAAITTYTPHTVDTTWRCYEVEITAPTDCVTIRVTLNGLVADTYEIDSFAFNKDEMVIQPGYPFDNNPDIVGVTKQSLQGGRVQHRIGTHWRYSLSWAYVEDAFFDRMVLLYESGETLYLDDGDVPDLTEQSTLYTNATYDHTGVTKPSTTHVAYYTESSDLPTSAGQFEDDEYIDAWYTDIAAETLRSHEYSASDYLYHKFIFRPSEYSTSVQRLAINIKSILDDLAVGNIDGVLVYVWNGSNWQEIFRTSSDSAEDITWYTYSASEAQSMVPQDGSESNGIVRILVRTRPKGGLISDVAASVYMSEDQSLTANTVAKIAFDTEVYDTEEIFDSDTDYSFTVPGAGLYLVDFQAAFNVNSANDVLEVFIRVNGSNVMSSLQIAESDSSKTLSGSKVLRLVAGDKIELWVRNATNDDAIDGGNALSTFMTITAISIAETSTSLGMYYVSLETNPGLGAVEPTHRMWFENNSESTDLTVKNRTDGTQLTTASYTVDYEDNEIDITGQDDGDVIEFTYSRMREVRIAQMPTRRQHDTAGGAVRRGMQVLLETITAE